MRENEKIDRATAAAAVGAATAAVVAATERDKIEIDFRCLLVRGIKIEFEPGASLIVFMCMRISIAARISEIRTRPYRQRL